MNNRVLPYNTVGMRQQPHGYAGYQGYGGANARPQSVADLLSGAAIQSEALGEVPPDIAGAQQGAGSQRRVADLLTSRAMGRQPTGIADGLASLGEAWIARKAIGKADAADTKYQQMVQALTQKAAAGDEASIAMLLSPEAAIGRKDQQARYGVEDEFTRTQLGQGQQGIDLQRSGLKYDQMHGDRVFGHTVEQDKFGNQIAQDNLALDAELGRGNLGVSRMNAETNRMGANTDAAALEAKTAAATAPEGGFRVAQSLQGAPDSVINSVINDEDTRLKEAAGKTASARKLSTLADEFMKSAEGYGSLGGGPLADIGQAFSQKTAELKGFTAQMIPMFRSAGEGPMTDPDAKRYELAALSINKGPGANEAARQVFKDFEADVASYEDFLRNYQEEQGYGSLREAERLWNEYKTANPIFNEETGERNQRPSIYDWMGGGGDDPELKGLLNKYGGR